MPIIQRTMSRQFSERGRNYKYRWLPDCILYPKLDYFSSYRAAYSAGFRSHYLELPTIQSRSKSFYDFHVTETAY